jgi:hypothetical protein
MNENGPSADVLAACGLSIAGLTANVRLAMRGVSEVDVELVLELLPELHRLVLADAPRMEARAAEYGSTLLSDCIDGSGMYSSLLRMNAAS